MQIMILVTKSENIMLYFGVGPKRFQVWSSASLVSKDFTRLLFISEYGRI